VNKQEKNHLYPKINKYKTYPAANRFQFLVIYV